MPPAAVEPTPPASFTASTMAALAVAVLLPTLPSLLAFVLPVKITAVATTSLLGGLAGAL